MLKTNGLLEILVLNLLKADNNEVVEVSNRADETVRNLFKSNKSKNKMSKVHTYIGALRKPTFLTPGAKEAFNRLKQAFIEAPILQYFDSEGYIQIETDASGYTIGEVLSQLSFDWIALNESNLAKNLVKNLTKSDFGQWYSVAYFSKKMISAETQYKTHDAELLAIVEAFKTWRYYLKGCKYEILVLTNYNNLRQFIDMKSLSSRQVRWAQELFRYYFRIDY